jgi:hypothetical protein
MFSKNIIFVLFDITKILIKKFFFIKNIRIYKIIIKNNNLLIYFFN